MSDTEDKPNESNENHNQHIHEQIKKISDGFRIVSMRMKSIYLINNNFTNRCCYWESIMGMQRLGSKKR